MLVPHIVGQGGSILGLGQGFGVPGHHGHFLQHHGVVHCFHGIFPPGKGTVMTGQHAGNVQRIQVMRFEVRGNHLAGFQLIGALNFLLGEIPGAGNGTINVIGMGGAIGGNVPGPAWAQMVAQRECVWTMPPTSGKRR